ncbi:tyrosine-type recombinase/integrase [Desulfurivibrio dismutans]|uniref:tyrosine-type recombinase/integrase n=1 Tax=Desulfurivibrio dismutans TaxID=1398908 RepID=UPI0023DCBE80|nr:integrase arm-type DNA-binding domain-containing protein [Desulfurivibrio alkaliphilus]MDF1613662.1 integrase arm-type DNA-binding domain-containing protein [Desulfurivibrio alkaliphilus]
MKLTKTGVEKLALPDAGQVLIWDDYTRGFGLRMTPGGKTYIIQGRVNGRTRRVSLGRHGVITTDEARRKAKQALAALGEGKDPTAEKQKARALSVTLAEVAEAYISDRRDLKQASVDNIRRHIKTTFKAWANKPAAAITRDKVATRFRQKTAESPAQANQSFRVLRALLNYARATYRPDDAPLLPENPCTILSDAKLWNNIKPRSRTIQLERLGDTWNQLQALREAPEQTTISRTTADIVAFLLLTGTRWSEAATLTWELVDLEEGFFRLLDPKNRNPVTLPLSGPALAILEARPRTSEYVFPSRTQSGHLKDPRGVFSKLETAAGGHVSPHDLRRCFRAIAGAAAVEYWKTKLLMNHKPGNDVTIKHYTETSDLRYLKPEADLIAAWILRQAKLAAAKVVDLETRRATA